MLIQNIDSTITSHNTCGTRARAAFAVMYKVFCTDAEYTPTSGGPANFSSTACLTISLKMILHVWAYRKYQISSSQSRIMNFCGQDISSFCLKQLILWTYKCVDFGVNLCA